VDRCGACVLIRGDERVGGEERYRQEEVRGKCEGKREKDRERRIEKEVVYSIPHYTNTHTALITHSSESSSFLLFNAFSFSIINPDSKLAPISSGKSPPAFVLLL
jgi:hypothetical protein